MALHARRTLQELRDLLLRPERFYADRDPDALLPYAIGAVALTVVASLAGLWITGTSVGADASPRVRRLLGSAFRTLLVVAPVATLVSWGVVAGVAYLLVRNRSPEASFERTFAVFAMAAVLEVPVIMLEHVDLYLALQSARLDEPATVADPTGREPLLHGAWVAATLWKGYVWHGGLRSAFDLDTVQATTAAGAAVVTALALHFA